MANKLGRLKKILKERCDCCGEPLQMRVVINEEGIEEVFIVCMNCEKKRYSSSSRKVNKDSGAEMLPPKKSKREDRTAASYGYRH